MARESRLVVWVRGPHGRSERLRPGVAFVLVGAVVLLMLTSIGIRPALAQFPIAPTNRAEAGASPDFPTPIHHVFVIDMDVAENSYVLQYLAFEKYLSQNFSYASQFYNYCNPAEPNLIAITSGSINQCSDNGLHAGRYNTTNIGDLVSAANETWMGFEQGMPTPCDVTNASPYEANTNPFLYFTDIYDNAALCQQHDVNFTAWYADVNASSTNPSVIPNYAFFVPDLADDSDSLNHNSSDSWLAQFVYTDFLRQPFMSDSVLFITYSEGTVATSQRIGDLYFTGGAVPLFVISPYSVGGPDTALHQTAAGAGYTNLSCPFSLLNTTEWLLGLGNTGPANYDGNPNYPAMKGLFNFSAGPMPMPLPPYNWTRVTSSPSSPSPRSGPAETYDDRDGYILLFGGQNATSQFNDTWTYQNWTWAKIASATGPSARAGAAIAYDADCQCAVLFGGLSGNRSDSDTWEYLDGVWTNLTADVGTAPGGLAWASLAYDATTGELVLFGGYGGTSSNTSAYAYVNATWLLAGNLSGVWTAPVQSAPSALVPRDEAALVYDPSLKDVVLFGGQNSTTAMADTWLFNSQDQWTPIVSKVVPPEAGAVADYDVQLGAIVLFGGTDNATYLNTTWILQQKTWSLGWAWPGPAQRAFAGGAYDPLQDTFVLFGGRISPTGASLKDTWVFSADATPGGVRPPTYAVTFQESGLPLGVHWAVTLGGTTNDSTKSTISFAEWNGFYQYHIAPVRGYTPSPSNESVLVSNYAVLVSITFHAPTGPLSSSEVTELEEIGIGVVILAGVVAFVVLLARRRGPPEAPLPASPSTVRRPSPPASSSGSPPPGTPSPSAPSTVPRPPPPRTGGPPPGG